MAAVSPHAPFLAGFPVERGPVDVSGLGNTARTELQTCLVIEQRDDPVGRLGIVYSAMHVFIIDFFHDPDECRTRERVCVWMDVYERDGESVCVCGCAAVHIMSQIWQRYHAEMHGGPMNGYWYFHHRDIHN